MRPLLGHNRPEGREPHAPLPLVPFHARLCDICGQSGKASRLEPRVSRRMTV